VAITAANTSMASRSVEQSNTFPTASKADDWLQPPSALQVDDDVPQAERGLENRRENDWEGEHLDDVVLRAYSEFGLENRQDNDWEEDNDDNHNGDIHLDDDDVESEDDVFNAMHDMYGTGLY
jgi:hypothetical protein